MRCLALILLLLVPFSSSLAAEFPAKAHAQLVEEVVAFLMSDVGDNGITTLDDDPLGDPAPPYFYHYAIQHTDNLASATTGYPGYASISYPGYTMSVAIDAFLAWWVFSGDPQGLSRAVQCADWLVDRRTPSGDLYAHWPFSTQTDGVMGGGYDLDAVMSDKPGMFGTRCLRLFDITGDTRYFDTAVEIADTYVATQRTGGVEEDGRWPFRVRPSDGLIRQDYTSHLLPAIELLEALEPRRPGSGYGAAAARAWAWLFANPLDPSSVSYMRWEGFYEDIGPESAGLRDHYSAEGTAAALIARGLSGDLEKAIEIRDWSTARYMAPDGVQNGGGLYDPALLEWDAWPNSTYAATGQWGVLQLRLHAATEGTPLHDPTWRDLGLRALHNLTYGQAPAASVPTDDGRMLTTIRELSAPNFGRETWYEQNFNTVLYLLEAFDLEPSLAPDDAHHIVGYDGAEPLAVDMTPTRLRNVWSGPGTVRMKLASAPGSVFANGFWSVVPGVQESGASWSYDPVSQVCSVSHAGGEVIVEAAGVSAAPSTATLHGVTLSPNPTSAGTQLRFQSPGIAVERVEVFDLRGRRVRVLDATPSGGAPAVLSWDGHDDTGRPVASGNYLLRSSFVDGASVVSRLVVVR